jgi:hypothetical protein
MTGLNFMSIGGNNLKGTIPSSFASLTKLISLQLPSNNLKGTIPSSLASLTQLAQLGLWDNALTGLVPPLPFKQYSGGPHGGYCCLDFPGNCQMPNCNHFKCPLPAGSEQCKDSSGRVSVHCK